MSGSSIVRLFLGAFRRKAPPSPFAAQRAVDLARSPAVILPQEHAAPLHPLAVADGVDGHEPIVLAPLAAALDGLADAEAAPPTSAVVEFVDEIRQLPLFSTTAMQLMQSVGDENVSPERVARLISADAGLVAQLLRIVNSPYYGLRQRCSTMTTAIAVLGLDQVRRTVLAAVTQRPLMAYLHDTRAVQAFWRHQLLCAALARHLAVRQGLDGEMAYTAGLMHEVGRLAILIRHPHLTDLLLHVDHGDERQVLRHERAQFGFDHAEVGGALLARWGLPPAIVRATLEHERVRQPANPLSAAVWRANLIAHAMAAEADMEANTEASTDTDTGEAVASPWMQDIGLSLEERRRMFDEIATLDGGSQDSGR